MARINKYLYEWDILVYYSSEYGYEVVCCEDTHKTAKQIARDYRNEGFLTRIKKVRAGLNPLHKQYKEFLNNEKS